MGMKSRILRVQALMAGQNFNDMLLDNENLINVLYKNAVERMQRYNLWIPLLEPQNLIRGNQILRKQATLLVKLGEEPRHTKDIRISTFFL